MPTIQAGLRIRTETPGALNASSLIPLDFLVYLPFGRCLNVDSLVLGLTLARIGSVNGPARFFEGGDRVFIEFSVGFLDQEPAGFDE